MRYDNRSYRYYVFLPDQAKIESGWEYREDAQDAAREWREEGVKTKVLTRKYLVQQGIDPKLNVNWGNPVLRNPGGFTPYVGDDGKIYL